MKNSYIINKTYEINELQYYILYVHVHYYFVILDGGPALKNPIVSTTHDSDVRTRPPDTWLNQSQATLLSWDNPMSLEMRGHWSCPGTCPGHFHKHWCICNQTGKLLVLGELIQHFVVGGDETCLMADRHHRDLHIIGAAGIKKHKKKTSDTRCSITLFCTGVTSGLSFIWQDEWQKSFWTCQFVQT
jgi:hypothetical protein